MIERLNGWLIGRSDDRRFGRSDSRMFERSDGRMVGCLNRESDGRK